MPEENLSEEEISSLYNEIRASGAESDEAVEAATRLGYREAVDVPVAVMTDWSELARGQQLNGRQNVLANDMSDWEDPVANLIHPDIDVEVLDRIREDDRFDHYVVRLSNREKLDLEVAEELEFRDFFRCLNPHGMNATSLDSKDWLYESFWDSGLPMKPGAYLGEAIAKGKDWLEDTFGTDEFVVMPMKGAGGYGIKQKPKGEVFDIVEEHEEGDQLVDEIQEIYEETGRIPRQKGFRIEPSLPVQGDIRAFFGPEGLLSAYVRYGPEDDFRSNISQLNSDNSYDKVLQAYEDERAVPYSLTGSEGLEKPPEPLIRLLDDAAEFVENNLSGGQDFFIGADVLLVDADCEQMFPEHRKSIDFRQNFQSYAGEEEAYVLSELHGNGAGGQLRYFHENYEELPVLHEYRKMHEMAGLEAFDPERIDSRQHPLHERIHSYYQTPEEAAHYAHETP